MGLVILIVVLLALFLIGSPVILAIGSSAIIYFIIKPGMIDLISIYAHKFFTGMDSFVFLAIPLFIMAGEIMGKNKMTDKLVYFSQFLVGRFRGGLAYVNVVVSMLFGGITGAALADISALGPIEISLMKKNGYPAAFAAALTASSALQGPIIPPSIPMVIFASLTNVSVGAMFLGGVIPGVMIGLGQMFVILLLSKKRHFPKDKTRYNIKEVFNLIRTAFFALLMPLIIIGGILGGIFTPTEAAAVAIGYASFVSIFIYRNVNLSDLREVLLNTARLTSQIYLIIAFSSIIGWIFAIERVPEMIFFIVNKHNFSPYFLFFLVNVFFLFNGMWISDIIQIVLFAPIFTPIFVKLGINPIHFGVVMVINVMVGMITPPYGTGLYVAAAVGNVKLKEVVKEVMPFTIISITVLFIVTYFPKIILLLPRYFKLLE